MKKKFSRIFGVALAVALLTSLMVAAVPASAVSTPSVILSNLVISNPSVYTVTFTVAAKVKPTEQIVVGFPAGTSITGMANTDITIETTAGLGGTAITPPGNPDAAVVGGSVATGQTLTITASNVTTNVTIGAGAIVQLVIGNVTKVTNPSTDGSYKLTVATQTAAAVPIEAAVDSAPYTITVPPLSPLAGVATSYNTAGIPLGQSYSITTELGRLGVSKVTLTPGTYAEDVNIASSISLVGSGGTAENIIIKPLTAAGVNIGATLVTLDNLTIDATNGGGVVAAGGTYFTIKNCIFKSGAGTLLTVGGTPGTVDTCTFAVTGYVVKGLVANAAVTVKNSTFSVDTGGTAIEANAAVTVSGVTVTGASGTGVTATAGASTIGTSTLKTLTPALNVAGGGTGASLQVTGSTIEGCGSSVAGAGNAITVSGNSTVLMYNNTIKDSPAANYALSASNGTVTAWFNNITGNALNVKQAAPGTVDARWNYWGAATGPALTSMSGVVSYVPYLGASMSVSAVAKPSTTSGLDASTTVGVAVSGMKLNVAEALDSVAVAKYSANPQIAAPPIAGVGSVLGYYDVTYSDAGADTLQIKFYGAVSSYTKIYYGGALSGAWALPSSWGINTAGGYVYVTITGTSSPSLADMTGLPFALVEDKTTAAPTLSSPDLGADGVSLTPTFVWSAVAGAIRYEFALSEDSAFTILKWSANVPNNMYAAPEELKYDTTYYWRVRGVLAEPYQTGFPPVWVTPSTPWATGIFTTEEEPVEAVTEVTVPAPKVDVTVEPAKITVEPAAPAIPDYILWVIIGVGAVLVIALIVLIVRTRRVA